MSERNRKNMTFDRLNDSSQVLKLIAVVLGFSLLAVLCVYCWLLPPEIGDMNKYETRKEEWKKVDGDEVMKLRKRVREEQEKGR